MTRLPKRAADFVLALRQLADGAGTASWLGLCVLMTRFCAVISAGLLLFFTVGVALGFGHDITVLKLLGGIITLALWPFGMGFMLGSFFYLRQRLQRLIQGVSRRDHAPDRRD